MECPQLVGGISDAQKTVSDLTEKGFGGTVGFVDAPPFIMGKLDIWVALGYVVRWEHGGFGVDVCWPRRSVRREICSPTKCMESIGKRGRSLIRAYEGLIRELWQIIRFSTTS